jgi:hypothetical protein
MLAEAVNLSVHVFAQESNKVFDVNASSPVNLRGILACDDTDRYFAVHALCSILQKDGVALANNNDSVVRDSKASGAVVREVDANVAFGRDDYVLVDDGAPYDRVTANFDVVE